LDTQNIFEAALFLDRILITIDGVNWYLSGKERQARKWLDCATTCPTGGATVLEMLIPGIVPALHASGSVEGAGELRAKWCTLSPVMRRRFLASDRTDLSGGADDPACHRTLMARDGTDSRYANRYCIYWTRYCNAEAIPGKRLDLFDHRSGFRSAC